ncbi:Primosomal protein N' (replication factor Y) - superfamily II helicase [Enhygromyxa salina]|uniref:Primosomal protein N' (Replication factor Y)-superfamily II helicase n=1 Tax=Enhygromyxa salina TaxID=215803 RepID=A0A0C2DCF5_9BACT|nr:Primosomal protein N' (replication factor Y) - superfamily II helicase [Enhygromyxa salina]
MVWDAAQVGAACLFCGTIALEVHAASEPLPVPDACLPSMVSPATADARFRAWAASSWLRPKALRSAKITVQPVMLPAWRFHSRLETHFAGLRRASTRSGKTPIAGVDHVDLSVMVPASAGLSQAELSALRPFDEHAAVAWTQAPTSSDAASMSTNASVIWEPPALTQQGARVRAHRELASEHRRRLMRSQGMVSAKVSAVVDDRDVRLLMVPVHIGVFRFRDRPWRFLINGQTGEVVGDAPIDWWKLLGLVAVALAVVVAVLLARQWT